MGDSLFYRIPRLLPYTLMADSFLGIYILGARSSHTLIKSPVLKIIGSITAFISILCCGCISWVIWLITGFWDLCSECFSMMPRGGEETVVMMGLVPIALVCLGFLTIGLRRGRLAFKWRLIMTFLSMTLLICLGIFACVEFNIRLNHGRSISGYQESYDYRDSYYSGHYDKKHYHGRNRYGRKEDYGKKAKKENQKFMAYINLIILAFPFILYLFVLKRLS